MAVRGAPIGSALAGSEDEEEEEEKAVVLLALLESESRANGGVGVSTVDAQVAGSQLPANFG
jgi:hypothetical protein